MFKNHGSMDEDEDELQGRSRRDTHISKKPMLVHGIMEMFDTLPTRSTCISLRHYLQAKVDLTNNRADTILRGG